jgi:superkiller protein 3
MARAIESKVSVQSLHARTASAVALCALLAGCQAGHRTLTADNVEHPREAAQEAEQSGDWRLAAERWYAVMLKDHESIEPCLRTARALMHTNDADNANHVLDVGLEKHPDDPELCELKGDVLVVLGFRRPAEGYYMRVLKVDPKRTSALLSIAKVRIELGWESAAVGPLSQAIAITGGDHESWYLLGIAQRCGNKPVAAFDAYVKAFADDAGTADELVTAATLPLTEPLKHSRPECSAVMMSWLERAVVRDPKSATAHFMIGVLNEDLGRRENAVSAYRRALAIDPKCLMSLRNLAVLYASMGDDKNTREIVHRALEIEQDGDRRAALTHLLEPFDAKTAATAATKP